MRLRRKRLLTVLDKDEIAPTVVAFPLMGVGAFTDPVAPPGVRVCVFGSWADAASPLSAHLLACIPLPPPNTHTRPNPNPHTQGPVSESQYVPDGCINPHPRFGTLVRNIRTRRGSKVDIQVPLFRDEETPEYKQGGGWKGE